MGAILSLLLGMLSGIPDNNNNKNKNKKSSSRHGGYDEEERFDNDFYDEESESEEYAELESSDDMEESENESSESSDESSESSDEISEDEDSSSDNEALSDFVMGTVEDNVYTSSFGNLTFTAPDNYVFYSDEEILDLMDLGADLLYDDASELYAELAQQTTIYDMVAQDSETGDNVIIMYENLEAYGSGIADLYDVDTYIEALDTQMESLASSGMTFTKTDAADVTFCGQDFVKTEYTFTMESYDYTTSQVYYITKNGDYMTVIILSAGAYGDGDLSALESCFS
ncbi:MAG: hypothetical protein LUD57_00130 [Ruminococcus sp.]|nr:hypothetical protein [Ruminococcus sp.]